MTKPFRYMGPEDMVSLSMPVLVRVGTEITSDEEFSQWIATSIDEEERQGSLDTDDDEEAPHVIMKKTKIFTIESINVPIGAGNHADDE